MTIDNITINVGDKLSFALKSERYPQIITGKVQAICDVKVATLVTDVAQYHSSISDAASLPPYTSLQYLILELEGTTTRIAVSPDWINLPTFTLNSTVGSAFLQVDGVSIADVESIMAEIFGMGYSVKVVRSVA